MSFSRQVKEEAAAQFPKPPHCRRAFLAAVFLHCGRIERGEGGISLIVESENETFFRKCFTFFRKTYNIVYVCPGDMESRGTKQLFSFRIDGENEVRRVLEGLGLEAAVEKGMDACTVRESIFTGDCCRRAFLKGCFICSGSVSAPDKSNHLEFNEPTAGRAEQLRDILRGMGIDAGATVRKKTHIVYVKDGDRLADVLTMIGAQKQVLAFWEGRVVRDVRNNINRQVNCETANLNKTVFAAFSQLEDIRLLEEHHRLRTLPPALKDLARIRLSMPDASLSELGRLLDPPVSKSGVNHRLKKLKELADEIRENKEDDYDHKDNDGSDSDGT